MSNKIRVLVVDDSSLMREAIKTILNSDSSIEVVGTAKSADEALSKAIILKPNVITMDINMPGKSGLDAINEIMSTQPTSIIVVSTMNVNVIIKALSFGAMDFITIDQDVEQVSKALIEKIKIASTITPIHRVVSKPPKIEKIERKKGDLARVVAIGVSTGGPQALQVLLSALPAGFPAALIIVQHMTAGFIEGLAEWLKTNSALDICVAKSGELLKNATVYLAPDIYNLKVSNGASIVLSEPAKKMMHVPSIDVMMKSVAEAYGERAIGVIMTGMSRDGVEGIRAIKDAGGTTIAQDEKSSAIFGMNKEAIGTGRVDIVAPLEKIAQELIKLVI